MPERQTLVDQLIKWTATRATTVVGRLDSHQNPDETTMGCADGDEER